MNAVDVVGGNYLAINTTSGQWIMNIDVPNHVVRSDMEEWTIKIVLYN